MPSSFRRLIAIAAIVVGVAGCSGTSQNPTAVDDQTYGNGAVPGATYFAADHRSTVGDVTGDTLQGAPLDLNTYRGKYVVVNYWSSTCAPCEAEADAFEALSKSLAPKGVQFVGIDLRDNRDAAMTFERAYHVTYPSFFDPTDRFLLAFPGAVPSTTPFTIVIDPHGGIAAKIASSLDYTHLKEFLHRALTEST
jgi:thiol-disulfide isomerase/thioredoxin